MTAPSVLLIGDASRPEFDQPCLGLASWGRLEAVEDIQAALPRLAGGRLAPDVIVVAQAYPGQFSCKAIDGLRRAAPLARVVGLMGTWCEGEMRTGNPWPAAVRIYWHQASPRFHRELAELSGARGGSWALPVTAAEEERLLLDAERPVRERPGLIAIHTDRFAMEDWLSAACRRRGGSTAWLRPPRPARVEGATAAIYDGPPGHRPSFDELRHLAAMLGRLPSGQPVPILALLDFPRFSEQYQAIEAGAATVLSKPVHLDDLYWHLDRLADETETAILPKTTGD